MPTDGGRAQAFVIMPFGEGFDEIYNLFLVDALQQAGFEVSRADDIRSGQNILRDIVRSIAECDLVVADLTDSNPNVYYELGLAHGIGKPVILLAQNVDELPFDLRSYRVIPYRTHFAEIRNAHRQLAELASGIRTGEYETGSPASDFLQRPVDSPARHRESGEEQGEAGLLDHMADTEEGFERLTRHIDEFGSQTENLTENTRRTTSRLETLQANPDRGSARQARTLFIGLAERLDSYARSLSSVNQQYTLELGRTRTALESLVRAQNPSSSEERESLEKFLSGLDTVEEGARQGLSAMSGMADTLRDTPSIERTYNRARDHAVSELGRLTENIEQTISMVSRAKEIGQEKLDRSESPGA